MSKDRASDGTGDDLHQIASFHRVVKNYSKMKKIEAMTKGTPQPTDKCAKCKKTYAEHKWPDILTPWCNFLDLESADVFTPIVPSPDSVKDMGEVAKHTPGPWKMATPNRLDKCIIINGVAEVYSDDIDFSEAVANAKLIAAAPATAARLEEVTREAKKLKEGLEISEKDLTDVIGERDELQAEVERYREALQLIRESAAYKVLLHEGFTSTTKLIDSLSRGATEQSTEQ